MDDLHARLFRPGGNKHPNEDIFYCFVVRCACGWAIRTKDGTKCLDNDDLEIHASKDKRELAIIPDTVPPERFHSLVVEKGAAVKRFREFVCFDKSQTYIEYLIAYKRTD